MVYVLSTRSYAIRRTLAPIRIGCRPEEFDPWSLQGRFIERGPQLRRRRGIAERLADQFEHASPDGRARMGRFGFGMQVIRERGRIGWETRKILEAARRQAFLAGCGRGRRDRRSVGYRPLPMPPDRRVRQRSADRLRSVRGRHRSARPILVGFPSGRPTMPDLLQLQCRPRACGSCERDTHRPRSADSVRRLRSLPPSAPTSRLHRHRRRPIVRSPAPEPRATQPQWGRAAISEWNAGERLPARCHRGGWREWPPSHARAKCPRGHQQIPDQWLSAAPSGCLASNSIGFLLTRRMSARLELFHQAATRSVQAKRKGGRRAVHDLCSFASLKAVPGNQRQDFAIADTERCEGSGERLALDDPLLHRGCRVRRLHHVQIDAGADRLAAPNRTSLVGEHLPGGAKQPRQRFIRYGVEATPGHEEGL